MLSVGILEDLSYLTFLHSAETESTYSPEKASGAAAMESTYSPEKGSRAPAIESTYSPEKASKAPAIESTYSPEKVSRAPVGRGKGIYITIFHYAFMNVSEK